MIYECELTEEDLEGDYFDTHDCPLFRSMKRAGVPILIIGGIAFSTSDQVDCHFSPQMQKLSIEIGRNTCTSVKTNLVGERFTVEL